ncbi:MAG: AEC family transporter [Chloroflexota bacterium]|nr:AEC family transporter [Chloroflexota bacterium]
MVIIDILAPIIILVALGTLLHRTGFLSRDFFRKANHLVYWVGLPSLLFRKTANAMPQFGAAVSIVFMLLAGMVGCLILGYLVAGRLGLNRPARASFIQGTYRSNLVYVGLPVVLYALAAFDTNTPETEALALLAIAPMVPFYNAVAVMLLLGAEERLEFNVQQQMIQMLRGVVTNPLVIACVLGVAFAYAGWSLPLFVDRTLEALGQMALPLALLGIGASLRLRTIREGGRVALAGSLIKILFAPLVGLLVALAVGISGIEMQIGLLYLTMPTAVMSYVMADQMGADGRLAGSIVVISTVLAMPALSVVLALTA